MKRGTLLYVLAALVIVTVLVVFSLPPLTSAMAVRDLARQVKGNINAAELQKWATNLLNRYPEENIYYMDYYGTNLPAGLKKIRGYYHWVQIASGDGMERRVMIFGGTRGEPYLLVGAATFVYTNSGALKWQPGIYFVSPRGG